MAESELIPTSLLKRPFLRHLRKRTQFRRKAVSDRRKTYALDTETTKNGDLLLLADNEGHYIDLKQTRLEDILQFLFHKRYQSSWNFFWNLHFDARIIIRLILMRLPSKELNKFYHTGRCKILGYSIHYIEEKKLSIKKGNHSVNYFDIMQFFPQKRLTDAYEKNIKKNLSAKYLEMKSSRGEFTKSYYRDNRNKIRKYCIDDCILTRELAEHWIDCFDKAFGFLPSHWISSGYLAEKILINNNVMIPTFQNSLEEIQELAWNAYYGGRIELVERGYNEQGYIYDINSCYPFALTKIPDITKGKWIKTNKLLDNSLIGFFKIKCNIPETKHITPFPFKVRNKIIFPKGEFITFVTLTELQACEDSSWYTILESWQFVDSNPFYPFKRIIEDLYAKRKQLQKENNPLELPIKIILNAIYGKTTQTTEGKIGNIFNPIIGSTITGIARGMLYDTIIKNNMELDVIMMYTDSICTKKKLELDSKKLGEFSCDFEGTVYSLQSGFYAKDGKWERSRGIGQIGDESIEHKDTKVDSKGRLVYEFKKLRVGTIKQNITRGTLENIGSFTEVTRLLKLNGDRGRQWWGQLTDVREKELNISTPFNLSLDDVSKI